MNAKWMSMVAALGIFAASAGASATPHVVNVPGYPTNEVQPVIRSSDLASGTLIRAQLQTTVSTRDAGPGTPFFATVRTPIMDAKGTIVIPAGTRITGRVRSVRHGAVYAGHARIALSVEGIRVNDRFVPVAANLLQYEVATQRTGLLRREEALLPAGSPIIVELTRPLPVARLLPARMGTSIGGGPRGHHHHVIGHRHHSRM